MNIVVRQNLAVRSLILDLDQEAVDRMFQIEMEMIKRGVYTNSRRSGPKIVDCRVVDGWFTRIFEIDESHADEFLSKLADGATVTVAEDE